MEGRDELESVSAYPNFDKQWKESDIVMEVEDRLFHVHKLILSLWSPVFEAMLNSDVSSHFPPWKESSSQCYESSIPQTSQLTLTT